MGVLFLPATLAAAWILALAGVTPPGATAGEGFEVDAIRWMLYLPMGWMAIVSGVMHTVFAKSTAKNIGWERSPFQYELGFVCLGLGVAGIVSAHLGSDAWIPLAIVYTSFLVFAGINHVIEMFKKSNFAPGNTLVLLYDFGLPISFWALLFAANVV